VPGGEPLWSEACTPGVFISEGGHGLSVPETGGSRELRGVSFLPAIVFINLRRD
jgi:hypothetical protein